MGQRLGRLEGFVLGLVFLRLRLVGITPAIVLDFGLRLWRFQKFLGLFRHGLDRLVIAIGARGFLQHCRRLDTGIAGSFPHNDGPTRRG